MGELLGPDGKPLNVEAGTAAFASAMAAEPGAAAGGEPDYAAPPRRKADRSEPAPPAPRRKRREPSERARTTTAPPSAAPVTSAARTAALGGLLQAASIPLVAMPALRPDAAALAIHGPTLIDAIDKTAQADPRFASVVDRLVIVGPYGMLVAASIPLVAQLVRNHGGPKLPGTEDPNALRADIEQTIQAMAAAADDGQAAEQQAA